jgi:hypothetical protein
MEPQCNRDIRNSPYKYLKQSRRAYESIGPRNFGIKLTSFNYFVWSTETQLVFTTLRKNK